MRRARAAIGRAIGALTLAALATMSVQAASPEAITVSNASSTPVTSATILLADHQYRLNVSGTGSDWCPPVVPCSVPAVGEGVDSLYCYIPWRCPTPELWRPLRINGKGLDELVEGAQPIAYNPAHS